MTRSSDFRDRAIKDGYWLLQQLPNDWNAQRALAALAVVEGFIESATESGLK